MELIRFYRTCLRHLPRAAWIVIGIVSTVATFAGAGVGVLKPFDPDAMNVIIVCLFVVIIIGCFLIVPWTQAFRVYQEKVAELEQERTRHAAELAERRREQAEEQRQWAKERSDLQAQLDDRARRRAARDALGGLLLRGQQLRAACADEQHAPPDCEADAWDTEAERVIGAHFGAAYTARFRNDAGLPMASNSIASMPHRRLWHGIDFRLARLEQFMGELATD